MQIMSDNESGRYYANRELVEQHLYDATISDPETMRIALYEGATDNELRLLRRADRLDDAIEFLRLFRAVRNRYVENYVDRNIDSETSKVLTQRGR